MFDRKKYKKYARIQLKSRWTVPVLITLLTSVVLSIMNLPELKIMFRDFQNTFTFWTTTENTLKSLNFTAVQTEQPSTLTTIVSWLSVFIEFTLTFAMTSVFIKMSHGPEPVHFDDFVDGLSYWAKAILAGLWKSLWLLLWTSLFIIPGFVKMYAYSQMEYLLLEYPELSVTKALKISVVITRGHKADLFVQDLSFIGWCILASIPAGIGFLWLIPYMSMTRINAYHAMLKEAVSTGLITQADLNE